MDHKEHHICPAAAAGPLDSRLRRWLQDPRKIVGGYIRQGMTVLDLGCGPGFFTLEMAQMVGPAGCVIACDVQTGMLERVRRKIQGTELERRVRLHQSGKDRIGLELSIDFVLAFYMVHELVEPQVFFEEIAATLNPGGQMLIVEPPFHVSRKAFHATLQTARRCGFVFDPPKIFLNKKVLLTKPAAHP